MSVNTNHFLQSGSLLGDFLDMVSAYAKTVRQAFGVKPISNENDLQPSPVIAVLEQDLVLGVTTLASARRAANIMILRLAPMPPDLVVWDLAGPQSDQNITEDGKFTYSIGFVKAADLEALNDIRTQENGFVASARYGGVYRFRSAATLVEKRKKTFLAIFGFAACYSCLLWASMAWADRPVRIIDTWQNQIRQARIETSQNRVAVERLEARNALIAKYQSNAQGADLLQMLSSMAQNLPDGAWVREVNYGNGQIKISGFTDDPAKLAALLEAKAFVSHIELGAISSDRASGLQRFNLTLFLAEQKP